MRRNEVSDANVAHARNHAVSRGIHACFLWATSLHFRLLLATSAEGRATSLVHGWFPVRNSSTIKIMSNRNLAGEACFMPCRASLVPAILKVSPHQPPLTAKAV
jgi:hypothetical protein